MRLAIGGPTRDLVPASFAVDVAELFAYTKARGPWPDVSLRFTPATYIHAGREWFLESMIKQGATHVLWLDTDMSFPRELAILLHGHHLPIVGCNYRVRQDSGLFTAQRVDRSRVETTAASTGLESVGALGFGAVLMRTDIVDGLARPWFRHGLNEQAGDIGEDIMFCRTLRAHGYDIMIDHDLSKELGHVGLHTYRTLRQETVEAVGVA
jgi:hypothetical protein